MIRIPGTNVKMEYIETPTIPGNYDFKQAQLDDWLNEYRTLLQRARWLQDKLLENGVITRPAIKAKS